MTSSDQVFNFNSDATLKDLLTEAESYGAEVVQSVAGDESTPIAAVVVIQGENTKVYLEAIRKIVIMQEETSISLSMPQ